MKTSFAVALAFAAAVVLGWPERSAAYDFFYDQNCAQCHGPTRTCSGCHAHGAHGLANKQDMNVVATANKASYTAGEEVVVTVTGGYRCGWVRTLLLDGQMATLAESSGAGGLGNGPDSCTAGGIALRAPAPSAPGRYTWYAGWYGNTHDLDDRTTGAVAAFGPYFRNGPGVNHGREFFPVTVTVVAGGTPAAALAPASLAFPRVKVGATAPLSARVQNTGSAVLKVTGITRCDEAAAAPFSWSLATPVSIAPGGEATLAVTYQPTAAASSTSCLRLATNDPANATLQLGVTGAADPAPPGVPGVDVSASTLSFGTGVLAGTYATRTFDVLSVGTANLVVTGLAPCAGTSAGMFTFASPLPGTIAPAEARTVTVSYTPTAAGTHQGCLTVATSAGPIDVRLSGAATMPAVTCTSCHGGTDNATGAPPTDAHGETGTSRRSVGAHTAHLQTQLSPTAARQAADCTACHQAVPSFTSPLHRDGSTDVPFGGVAKASGLNPSWNPQTPTCGTVYCHGATLAEGTNTAPTWTSVGTGEAACGRCHGVPPVANHPAVTGGLAACVSCHPETMTAEGTLDPAGKHIDGSVETAGCTSCHGSSANPAPPADTQGASATTSVSVGAHQQHVTANAIAAPLACTECHGAASGSYGSGHANGVVEVSFGALSNTGVTSSWNRAAATCATYCHGGASTPLKGGTATAPVWTRVDGTQASCGSCHGFPPPAPHSQSTACETCHPATVKAGGAIDLAGGKHLDGVVQVDPSTMSCSGCHGTPGRTGGDPLIAAAPPNGTKGESATTTRAVGAHLAHLQPGTLSKAYACTDCHNPPTAMDHANGVVEMSFSALAKGTGAPVFNGTTCASTYCHGNFTNGNTANAPTWTGGAGQVGCTSCHASPPGGTHPANAACGNCHPGSSATSVDPLTHADGHVDLLQTCTSCHGTTGVNAAPPKDTKGQSATTLVSVGAHQAHAATTLRAPIDCAECHGAAVTSYTNAHPNSSVEMSFGALSNSLGGATVWNRTAATCASNACHGGVAALKGGTATTPVWTRVDGTQKTCASCHGNPPPTSSGHVQRADCGSCHPGYTNASVNLATHLNGAIDYPSQTCTSCHGTASASYAAVAGADANVKAAPPVDTRNGTAVTSAGVGVHQAHVNGPRAKPVACAECHAGAVPAANQPIHANGVTTVAFGALSRTGGVAPAYVTPALTCASTYCHGNFAGGAGAGATPAWTAAGALGCASCHGNPPTTSGHPANTACADCHGAGYTTTTVNAATHVDGLVTLPTAAHPAGSCAACHGDATKTVIAAADANAKSAPPVGTRGETATTTKAVGVHAAHLNQTTYRAAPIACSECHAVPAAGDKAHANGAAALAFGTLSRTGNITTAAWNATALTCASTYCHGNFKNGNTAAAPSWTAAGSVGCTSCHGSPPGGTHPAAAACGSCHEGYTATTVNAAIHLNGIFEPPIGMTCSSCHGDRTRVAIAGGETAANAQTAPPVDAKGNSAVTARGVGLHQVHVAGGRSKPQLCSECHVLPTSMTHSDGVSQVAFSRSGAFNATALTCASTYCHGNFTGGAGTAATPAWTAAGTLACTSCHGNPPAAPHPQDTACADCHGAGYTTTAVNTATHVDGAITLPTAAHPAGSCTACHGDATKVVIAAADPNAKAAPPIGTRGETATTTRAVGAHAAHLNQTTFRPTPVGCGECHAVPAAGDKAHGNNASSMPFGTLARTGGAAAQYTATATSGSCATVYCHGGAAGIQAGSASTPSWTGTFTPGASSLGCGSCHPALPTANGHPQRTDCGTCHPGATATAYSSVNHLNGVIDVPPQTCATCHGNASVVAVAGADPLIQAAPPLDTKGNGGTTAVGVGVHQAHVNTARAKPVACAACHAGAIPAAMNHANGVVTVAFAGLSTTGGVAPTYQPAGGSCAATYCHGNFTGGAGAGATPAWIAAGTLGCASCHGNPPALPHPQDAACAECHGAGYSTTAVNAATHVDGLVTLPTAAHPAGTCTACHGDGTKTVIAAAEANARAAPPISSKGETTTAQRGVGAHAAHLNQTTFRATPVACAECHRAVPANDRTHANATAAVAFGTAATYRGAAPVWNAASLSCSSVYCHGNFPLGNGNGAGGGAVAAPTAAPAGVAFSGVTASSLGLSWAAVAGATSYKVERAPNNAGAPGAFAQVGTASGASYADAGLAASTTYWYRVRATNSAGDGPYSTSASQATTAAGTGTIAAPTAAPTGLAFSAVAANSLTVGWTAVPGAMAYKVERAPNNAGVAGTFVQVGTAAGTSYSDAGLTASTTYWYRVRATNDGGDGPYSANASRATATASTGGTGTATRYDLAPATATSVGADGSTNVTSQTTYGYNNPTQTFRALGVAGYTPSSTQGRFRADSALAASTTYGVVNLYTPALTASNASVAANVPVSIDYYVRTGASGSTATIRAVLYEYSATTGNVGAAKGTYTSPSINTSSSTSTYTTLSGTIPNAAFTVAAGNRLKVVFQVVTGSTGGNDVAILFGATRSGTSGQTFVTPTLGGSTGTTPTAPTAAPTTLAFTNVGQTTLTLGWSAVTGATHYKVERAPNVSGAPGTFVQVGTTATASFGDAGRAANTTYWYRVRAWNAGGDGPYSASASQTTTAPAATTPPAVAPATLAFGSVAPTSLSLSWAGVPGATHYKVERAPDLSGAPGTFAQVGTTATASYGDAGLTAGTRYWYRVRGWNAGGDGPYSANASQSTAAVAPPTGGISWTGAFTPGTSSLSCQSCHGMPPAGTHPALAAGTNCGGCHTGYNAVAGATTGSVHPTNHLNAMLDPDPPGGEPTAATTSCGGCHGAILATMNGTTAKASKHTLGTDASADAAVSWTGTSLTASVPAASRSCTTMCHSDHAHGTTTHNANVYADATTQTTRAAAKLSTDFDAAQASGGLCTSCHQKPVDAANPAQRPAVTKADYQGKAHDFVQNVVGTTTNAWQYTLHDGVGAFQRNCTKCHASQAEGQTPTIAANGSGNVGPHASDFGQLLAGNTNPGTTPASYVCYNCHGDGTTGKNLSGKVLVTDAAKAQGHGGFLNRSATHDRVREATAAYNSGAYSGTNRHASCADCHDEHRAGKTKHTPGTAATNQIPASSPLYGASGVGYTGTLPANWAAIPAANLTRVATATAEYQICFKCHTGWAFGTTPPTGPSTLAETDLAQEFNVNNKSVHPVVNTLAAQAGSTAKGLVASQLLAPWTASPGNQTMTCSDCHNSDAASTAAQGPHGSAVRFMLSGTNKAWPYTVAGATSGTLFRVATSETGLSTANGLFCRNCHPQMNSAGSNSLHRNSNVTGGQHGGSSAFACTGCHIRIPHGGKVSRLLVTTNAPARYKVGTPIFSSITKGATKDSYSTSAYPTGFARSCGTHSSTAGAEAW